MMAVRRTRIVVAGVAIGAAVLVGLGGVAGAAPVSLFSSVAPGVSSVAVPAGVCFVTIVADGGHGGSPGAIGGVGVEVTARFAVTPGTVLGIEVGGAGADGTGAAAGPGGAGGGGGADSNGGGGRAARAVAPRPCGKQRRHRWSSPEVAVVPVQATRVARRGCLARVVSGLVPRRDTAGLLSASVARVALSPDFPGAGVVAGSRAAAADPVVLGAAAVATAVRVVEAPVPSAAAEAAADRLRPTVVTAVRRRGPAPRGRAGDQGVAGAREQQPAAMEERAAAAMSGVAVPAASGSAAVAEVHPAAGAAEGEGAATAAAVAE